MRCDVNSCARRVNYRFADMAEYKTAAAAFLARLARFFSGRLERREERRSGLTD
jgi:hypothetical protein